MRNLLILITLFLTFTVSVQSTEQTNEKKMKTTLDETINNEKKIKATLDEAADIVKDLTTTAELEVSGTVTDLTRESFYQLTKAIKSQKNTIKLNLTKINGLNKIEKKTFEKCSNLQEITLPNNIYRLSCFRRLFDFIKHNHPGQCNFYRLPGIFRLYKINRSYYRKRNYSNRRIYIFRLQKCRNINNR